MSKPSTNTQAEQPSFNPWNPVSVAQQFGVSAIILTFIPLAMTPLLPALFGIVSGVAGLVSWYKYRTNTTAKITFVFGLIACSMAITRYLLSL